MKLSTKIKNIAIKKGFKSNLFKYFFISQTELQKWLREKCKIDAFVIPTDNLYHSYVVSKNIYFIDTNKAHKGIKKSFEEALELSLEEGLKLLKNK